mgnify:CR=1 FL=1
MAMQIPCRVYPEVSAQDAVRLVASAPWGGISSLSRAEREPDSGRAPDCGSRSYADFDPAEVCGVAGDRVHQRQECDSYRPHGRGPATQFCRTALLGSWVLRLHGGTGRESDPRVHPVTGSRGSTPGSDADVRLTAAAGGSQTTRFERFTFQASGFAGGIDYLKRFKWCCRRYQSRPQQSWISPR